MSVIHFIPPTMTALSLDLETLPTADALALPYPEDERTPPSNYGAEAREKWREKDRAAWEQERIKTYSLSPLYGRVCAIGLAWEDATGEVATAHMRAETEAEEPEMLREFWAQAHGADCLVTWNGMDFDVPFLLVRSLVHDLDVPFDGRSLTRRYAQHPHYDVKQVITGWNTRGKGSLDDYLRAFRLPTKTAHGSEVYGMAQRGEWQAIGDYAAADAAATLALYHRVSRVF